jgi:DNA-binding response OmpR family regulator
MLDIMLPGEDGITILKKIRANAGTTSIPVMMITAKSTEFDKVSGLDLGADIISQSRSAWRSWLRASRHYYAEAV